MKLYHYEHCPFCQRVRLFLGFKGISYEKILLSYDDSDTTQDLGFPKMLPLMDFGNGKLINESLDILREIEMTSPHPIGYIGPVEGKIAWAASIVTSIPQYFDILLPYLYDHYTREFQEVFPQGGTYFKENKETKRGKSFSKLKNERKEVFIDNILPQLEPIIELVEDEFFIMGPTFSVADCILAADLSGLRLIPNIDLPGQITHYIERVEKKCNVSLLENAGK